MTRHPPIRVQDVWERDCPVLRYAYDLQQLAAAGIHPRDADRHMDYWQAYDARAEQRANREARERAMHDRLLADLAAIQATHASGIAARHGTRPRAPRRRLPTRKAA